MTNVISTEYTLYLWITRHSILQVYIYLRAECSFGFVYIDMRKTAENLSIIRVYYIESAALAMCRLFIA